MKIDFNITLHIYGFKGQVHAYGRFSSKKKAVEALDTSMYHFNDFASIGALGNTGKLLIPLYPENTLIVIIGRYLNIDKPFNYWVKEEGEWVEKTYDSSKQKSIHNSEESVKNDVVL